uniref:uncharacterized protein LOC122587759 n=1 Tax=Erigeron canadensis TaxID=72917 RepID=UPI001CB99826|nr:uncharacterized protein LOC122587759 [Erigeron canadensis]
MTIDKSWIAKNKNSTEFWNGLQSFLVRCRDHLNSEGRCRCPCRNCINVEFGTIDEIERHIHSKGFCRAYQTWVHHGESFEMPRTNTWENIQENTANEHNANNGDNSNQSTRQGESSQNADLTELFSLADTELYPDCDSMSSLDFVAKISHMKAINHWTDSSFDQLLEFFKFVLPKENKVPKSQYEAKKLMNKVGLGYQSIHACKNDCCLFWKHNEKEEKCPRCKESRWKENKTKGKKVPNKVLRYFPLTPRLKRMYSFKDDAKAMTWHATGMCTEDGKMRHPVDGKAWKDFDERYPDFAIEPRNVRLGLSADGFIPFANTSIPYSMWPVILTTYNTPPWLCMKETSLMLTLLIPGPKSAAKDIDIYFEPLVDELKSLWSEGVYTRDAATNEVFKMRAMLLWTISDFPARSYLSGWSGQGYLACPTCNEDTPSTRVRGKISYVGHRRHKWRMNKNFNGKIETRRPPNDFSENDILSQLNKLPKLMPGKHPSYGGKNLKRKREEYELNWSKRSIFFDLDYWSSLTLKHNLDVMHIEKNVCESLLETLLMNDKSKDTINARKDLKDLNIRKDLWLIERGGSTQILFYT